MEETSHLVEPITELTDCMFGVFDPATAEDVLVLLGVVDGDTMYRRCNDDGRVDFSDLSDGGPLVHTGARIL